MARFTSTKTSVEIHGLNNVMLKLQRLALWSEKDHNALVNIGERVGSVYTNYLEANVRDYKRDILVQFKDRDDILVKRGQLRRSLGLWQPDKNHITVLAGPRTNNIGKRKTTKYADGWYAHIVEGGDSFGKKKTTANTGVFERGQNVTNARARKLHLNLLKRRFSAYFKTA